MACCLLAAFLLAQAMATVRRWGMFWGIVRIPEGEVADTLAARWRGWFAQPVVRWTALALGCVELLAVGTWTYVRHGEHIAQLADMSWSRLHGQHVVYAGMCGMDGRTSVRLVLNRPNPRTSS
jgi:hypothetical protein